MSGRRSDLWARLVLEGLAITAGVLLAFAVDAWWDGRKAAADERESVTDLRQELRAIRSHLETTRALHEGHLASQRLLLSTATDSPSPALAQAVASLLRPVTLDAPTGATDAAASSLGLGRIATDSLRSLITRWPGAYYDLVENESAEVDLVMQSLFPLLREHLNVPDLATVAGTARVEAPSSSPDTLLLERDLRELIRNPSFLGLIYQHLMNESVLVSEYDELAVLVDFLLEGIEASLEQ